MPDGLFGGYVNPMGGKARRKAFTTADLERGKRLAAARQVENETGLGPGTRLFLDLAKGAYGKIVRHGDGAEYESGRFNVPADPLRRRAPETPEVLRPSGARRSRAQAAASTPGTFAYAMRTIDRDAGFDERTRKIVRDWLQTRQTIDDGAGSRRQVTVTDAETFGGYVSNEDLFEAVKMARKPHGLTQMELETKGWRTLGAKALPSSSLEGAMARYDFARTGFVTFGEGGDEERAAYRKQMKRLRAANGGEIPAFEQSEALRAALGDGAMVKLYDWKFTPTEADKARWAMASGATSEVPLTGVPGVFLDAGVRGAQEQVARLAGYDDQMLAGLQTMNETDPTAKFLTGSGSLAAQALGGGLVGKMTPGLRAGAVQVLEPIVASDPAHREDAVLPVSTMRKGAEEGADWADKALAVLAPLALAAPFAGGLKAKARKLAADPAVAESVAQQVGVSASDVVSLIESVDDAAIEQAAQSGHTLTDAQGLSVSEARMDPRDIDARARPEQVVTDTGGVGTGPEGVATAIPTLAEQSGTPETLESSPALQRSGAQTETQTIPEVKDTTGDGRFEVRDAASFGRALRGAFSEISEDQALGVEALAAARANAWGRKHGRNPGDWYGERIAEFRVDDPDAVSAAAQSSHLGAKGAHELLDDGRAVIHAFTGALEGTSRSDVSTVVHESLGHVFFNELDPDEMQAVRDARPTGPEVPKLEEWFARGFERYLADGEAPVPELKSIFEKFKQWMRDIYLVVRRSPIGRDLPESLRLTYDRLLGSDDPLPIEAAERDRVALGERATSENFGFDFQESGPVDGWRRKAEEVAERMSGPMWGADARRFFENAGVKADEMKWTGLDALLSDRDVLKVSPEQVREALASNRVVVRDVTRSNDSDGSRRRERVRKANDNFIVEAMNWNISATIANDLALNARGWRTSRTLQGMGAPQRVTDAFAELHDAYMEIQPGDYSQGPKYERAILPGGERYRELLMTMPQYEERFSSPHWDEKNVLMHMRTTDRLVDGAHTLFLEEVQSDWHQKGRTEGYRGDFSGLVSRIEAAAAERGADMGEVRKAVNHLVKEPLDTDGRPTGWAWATLHEATDGSGIDLNEFHDRRDRGVATGPLSKTWHEAGMKRAIRLAAEEGYEALAWTTGDTQALRYSQMVREQADFIGVVKRNDGQYEIEVKNGEKLLILDTVDDGRLRQLLGASMAQEATRALESGQTEWTSRGEGINIGGHGMRAFYDVVLPNFLKKYVKRWGAELESKTMTVSEESEGERQVPVHFLRLTDEMRRSVLNEGQYLFQHAEAPEGTGAPIVVTVEGAKVGSAKPMDLEIAPEKASPELVRTVKDFIEPKVVGFAGNPLDQIRFAGTAGSPARVAGRALATLTEKALSLSTAHATRLSMKLDKAVSSEFGKLHRLAPRQREAANGLARKLIKVQVGEGSLDDLTPAERAVNEVKANISRALVAEAESLKVMVDRSVIGDMRFLKPGEEVLWYGESPESGALRMLSGTVVGHGAEGRTLLVKPYGANGVQELGPGRKFRTRQLVKDDEFFPLRLREEALQEIADEKGPAYEAAKRSVRDALERGGEDISDDQVVSTIRSMFGVDYQSRLNVSTRNNDIVYTSGPSRLERQRAPVQLPSEFYEDDFYGIMTGHIASSAKRLVMSKVFGNDSWRVAELVGQMSGDESVGVLDQWARAMGNDKALTNAERQWRSVTSAIGMFEALTKMTGLGTALVQVGALGNSAGVLGYSAAARGLVAAVKAIGKGEKSEIQAVKRSGAVSSEAIRLMGVDDADEIARFVTSAGLTATGVKPADTVLRYHAALTGRISAQDAVNRLNVRDGKVQRDASYRLLSDWFLFPDADIARMAKTRTLTGADVVVAYHGGAKTQLRSRDADVPSSVSNSPVGRTMIQLQSFNYQQVKLIGWAAKEAARGNPMPLLRTFAAYAALGWLTVDAKEKLVALLENKAAPEYDEDFIGTVSRYVVRGGMLGLLGRPVETQMRLGENDEDVTASERARAMSSEVWEAYQPVILRDLANAMGAFQFAKKTGSVSGGIDEWLRKTVVPYGRIAKRGDPDYRWIERRRSQLKSDLESEGWSDTDVRRMLDKVLPRPAPRGTTDEYRKWLVDYWRLVNEEGYTPDEATDELGRRPKRFAGDTPKREAKYETGEFAGEIEDAKPMVTPDGRKLVGARQ